MAAPWKWGVLGSYAGPGLCREIEFPNVIEFMIGAVFASIYVHAVTVVVIMSDDSRVPCSWARELSSGFDPFPCVFFEAILVQVVGTSAALSSSREAAFAAGKASKDHHSVFMNYSDVLVSGSGHVFAVAVRWLRLDKLPLVLVQVKRVHFTDAATTLLGFFGDTTEEVHLLMRLVHHACMISYRLWLRYTCTSTLLPNRINLVFSFSRHKLQQLPTINLPKAISQPFANILASKYVKPLPIYKGIMVSPLSWIALCHSQLPPVFIDVGWLIPGFACFCTEHVLFVCKGEVRFAVVDGLRVQSTAADAHIDIASGTRAKKSILGNLLIDLRRWPDDIRFHCFDKLLKFDQITL